MPDVTQTQSFDFSDAPGGDTSLDDIFSFDDNPVAPTTTQIPPVAQNAEPETFLKTSTGTVYKTVDDAVAGIEHKDALITQLRQQLANTNGVDPIRPKTEAPPENISYLENPKKYFDDIKAAKTEQELIAVQSRFVQENMAPYAGIMASVTKTKAIEDVASEIPEINTFLRSDDYKQTLEKYPLLQRSIQVSESNPQVSGDLSQLYRMAYNASAGSNVARIVQTNTARTVTETRPTVSSTTPLAPSGAAVARPSMTTSEGRKSIAAEQEAKGVLDLRF